MSRPIQSNDDRGFALAALIIFLTAFSIAAAAVVPAYQTQAQREQEQEMIFRGQEYVRAIQKYQRSFGIYPPDIESLLDTNGIRFLRRPYTNPITGEGFRLLTINPDGSINGSVVYESMMENPDLFRGGDPRMFGEGQPTNSFTNQNGTVGMGLSGAPRQGGPRGGGGAQQGGFGAQAGAGFGQQNQGFGQGRWLRWRLRWTRGATAGRPRPEQRVRGRLPSGRCRFRAAESGRSRQLPAERLRPG